MKQGYAIDPAWTRERERLSMLESVLDPGSIRHLERLGVSEGWSCLDVGAGGGSIAEWLCRRVGGTGQVLATDLDTRFLDALEYPNLEVIRHDVRTEELPNAAFDLVHARALLVHLADRDLALRHLVRALKPGGWLLVEEPDYVSIVADPRFAGADRVAKYVAAALQFLGAAGFDHGYGRRLFGDVRAAGLDEVDAEGRVGMAWVDTPEHEFNRLTFAQLRDRLISANLLTDAEATEIVTALDDRDFLQMGPIWMAVWGRKRA